MPTTAQSIVQRVAETLFDLASTRWTVPRIVRYLNDGQREIATLRPDALTVLISHPLVGGFRQTLPTDGEKVIDVEGNTGGSRRAVTPVSQALLSAQEPSWRSAPGATEILHWMYDPREPKTFEVYPPAAVSGGSLQIKYLRRPVDIAEPAANSIYTAVAGNISVGDLFANALQDYILARCHMENTQDAQPARAMAHASAFAASLQVELKATTTLAALAQSQSA